MPATAGAYLLVGLMALVGALPLTTMSVLLVIYGVKSCRG